VDVKKVLRLSVTGEAVYPNSALIT